MDYSYADIKEAYKRVGLHERAVVMLRADLRWLGRYENADKNETIKAHYNSIADLMDFSRSTLVVSTASVSLCNTEIVYNPKETPSEMGILTEYVRKRPHTIRSFHPFLSYAAIGKDAEHICTDVARHAFGPETPKSRMIDMNALCVSVGIHPRFTCTTVHHVEFMMGVPYRYVKEFIQPVVRDSRIVKEPFYLYVWYRDCEIKRNFNQKLFQRYSDAGYELREARLGRGKIYSYPMREFYFSTIEAFKDDIYVWLDKPPRTKPYIR